MYANKIFLRGSTVPSILYSVRLLSNEGKRQRERGTDREREGERERGREINKETLSLSNTYTHTRRWRNEKIN